MPDVAVLDDPTAAAVALDPVRSRLLAALAEAPASAAAVAARVGLARQKAGYHLRALEEHGLVVEVERRRHGGLTERVLAPAASSFLVSPAALGAAAADPRSTADRLSAGYLLALAGRVVREVGAMLRGAEAAGKRLPTLSIDTEVRFRSASDRAAFADDLAAAVRTVVARHHHDGGRPYRVVVAAHPRPTEEDQQP